MIRGLDIRERPSPNYDQREADVSAIIIHYTGMPTLEGALGRLTNSLSQVSCHYLVCERGNIYHLVREERRAWHAGESFWRGHKSLNNISIGIELENPGHDGGYRDFTEPQITTLVAALRDILSRHDIAPHNIVGHADIAPGRKADPGERFPWPRLAEAGIGLWHGLSTRAGGAPVDWGDMMAVTELQDKLVALGFSLVPHGTYDAATEAAVKAFQRHWQPGRTDGMADQQSLAILEVLIDKAGNWQG